MAKHVIAVIAIPMLTAIAAIGNAADQEPSQTGESPIAGQVDGTSMSWILQEDQRAPSAVYSTVMLDVHRFTIAAYKNPRFARDNSVRLEFVVRNGEANSLHVYYFPFAQSHPRFALYDRFGEGSLNIKTLEFQDGVAHLTAEFEGTLFYHQSPNTLPISHRTRDLTISLDLKARME